MSFYVNIPNRLSAWINTSPFNCCCRPCFHRYHTQPLATEQDDGDNSKTEERATETPEGGSRSSRHLTQPVTETEREEAETRQGGTVSEEDNMAGSIADR